MSTLRLNHSVFMHIPKTGGTTATLAFGKSNMVSYDYRYHLHQPYINYYYDDRMELVSRSNGKVFDHTKVHLPVPYGPHARIKELLTKDKTLPKITIIRNPIDWYKSYWCHHKKYSWTTEPGMPYLYHNGSNDFEIWINNMIDDAADIGYCTKYFHNWIDDITQIVRLEHIISDMAKALDNLNEATNCLQYMNNRKNSNPLTNRLVLSTKTIMKIEELDHKILEFY